MQLKIAQVEEADRFMGRVFPPKPPQLRCRWADGIGHVPHRHMPFGQGTVNALLKKTCFEGIGDKRQHESRLLWYDI